ncbi:hypothetical protein BKA93DRAFT_459878 [Sparassis latifolia]
MAVHLTTRLHILEPFQPRISFMLAPLLHRCFASSHNFLTQGSSVITKVANVDSTWTPRVSSRLLRVSKSKGLDIRCAGYPQMLYLDPRDVASLWASLVYYTRALKSRFSMRQLTENVQPPQSVVARRRPPQHTAELGAVQQSLHPIAWTDTHPYPCPTGPRVDRSSAPSTTPSPPPHLALPSPRAQLHIRVEKPQTPDGHDRTSQIWWIDDLQSCSNCYLHACV